MNEEQRMQVLAARDQLVASFMSIFEGMLSMYEALQSSHIPKSAAKEIVTRTAAEQIVSMLFAMIGAPNEPD